ncbi:hypothetical protein PG985_016090 [Apiospora marii]|uniref:Uncharacterized protein n=1 Tax=Apiospora marii TaxID=335849 RepID=A0ABR1S3G3_9PEZI
MKHLLKPPTGGRPNKKQRVSQPPDVASASTPADTQPNNECASQTFVTDDDRLITDSIPNHVRRHDAEIARQGKSLQALLNAHGGFGEQLQQCDAKLDENKMAIKIDKKLIQQNTIAINSNKNEIQQLKNSSKNAAVDEQFKLDVAAFQDATQARFDAIDRNATLHNEKVHQAMSAMAQCLQELGHLVTPPMEADQPSHVPGVRAKATSDVEPSEVQELPLDPLASEGAGSENPQHSTSDDGSDVYEKNYFDWLDSLDFRTHQGMVQYTNATLRFYEVELFRYYPAKYYIVPESQMLPALVTKARHERGYRDKDCSSPFISHEELLYLARVVEMAIPPQCGFPDGRLPRYVLPLGHLFVNNPGAAVPAFWTGFHVVMDITTPKKSLWLVYCHEGDTSVRDPSTGDAEWPSRFQNMVSKGCDLIRLVPSTDTMIDPSRRRRLSMEIISAIKDGMRNHSFTVRPVFTLPCIEALLQAIKGGWAGYNGGSAAPR